MSPPGANLYKSLKRTLLNLCILVVMLHMMQTMHLQIYSSLSCTASRPLSLLVRNLESEILEMTWKLITPCK